MEEAQVANPEMPFPEDELEVLQTMPFQVFLLVASADGTVDKQETDTFVRSLLDLEGTSKSKLSRVVFSACAMNYRKYWGDYTAGKVKPDLDAMRRGVGFLNKRLPPTDSRSFRSHLYELGVAIAKSSGGILGGAISLQERMVLDQIKIGLDLGQAMERPKRWDKTFASDLGLEMTDDDLDRLLKLDPFRKMDPKKFPGSSPLREILRNDARIMRYTPSKQKKDSEIVVRQGDYGSSAFLVLSGKVEVVIDAPAAKLGRTDQKKRTFMESFSQLWKNPNRPEVRDPAKYKTSGLENLKGAGGVHVFLNDAPVVIKNWGKAEMKAGAIFGEQSALGRVPRAASIVTVGDAELLEIRWQGLRDIMKNDQALKDYIYKAYRERTLMGALRATPIFRHLSDPDLVKVADQVQFETYGDFDWNKTYKKMAEESASVRLSKEPLIVEEGQYLNGLIIVRAGFTRVTEKFGSGERTLSYLGPGGIHGLDEIAHNWRKKQNVPWQHSLRSLGYVDVLVIPTSVIEQVVLPSLPPNLLPPPIVQHQATAKPAKAAAGPQIETDMLEFLVENRYINGTASMMIDIDRCTRCDDCVRACASTHNNNPRFIRHGRQHSHYMIANACMHCADPVCMIGCPTGAIHRSAIQGQVVINDQTCIGCATCANSCPYHNIRMIEIRDKSGNFILDEGSNMPIVKATKCDLCFDQLGGPACQRACPHDALKRVDMRDTGALAAWLNR